MPKPDTIELNDDSQIPILFENRSVLAIDKPAGWMLVPFTWQKTNRNLHAAIVAAIASGKYWAKSRGLKYLCHIHRIDTDTTGILLLAKSRGALDTISDLFESRQVSKRYLAVVQGAPKEKKWTCRLKLSQDERQIGRVVVDEVAGKESETHFEAIESRNGLTLVDARPVTGRTHQIRVHLASAGLDILGDELYGRPAPTAVRPGNKAERVLMALRSIDLSYKDPFTRKPVDIHAPFDQFARKYGFNPALVPLLKSPVEKRKD